MKNKVCAGCKEELPIEMFQKAPKNTSTGYHSYCKDCNRETMWKSKIRNGDKSWHRNGFRTEEEEFNYALRVYAEVFDCPALLKHQTITGSIKRYYNDDLNTKYKYYK